MIASVQWAVCAVPLWFLAAAMAPTVARFGAQATITANWSLILRMCLPLALWAAYRQWPPATPRRALAWAAAAVLAVAGLLSTPLLTWGLVLTAVVIVPQGRSHALEFREERTAGAGKAPA